MKVKAITLIVAVILILTTSGCRKEVLTGPVMFWTDVDEGQVRITINGQQGFITGYVSGGVPNCGNGVSATFHLPEGYYTYTAVGDPSPSYPNGYSITGNVHALVNQCQAYQL